MLPIHINEFDNIVVLSGAGISAGSGLKTFRGPGGIWKEADTRKLSSTESVRQCPDLFWKFWGSFRSKIQESKPNEAHLALARWECRISKNQSFTLITQNVDQLHQRAGSKNVIDLHGNLFKTRCSNSRCSLPGYTDSESHENGAPRCALCGSVLRPDIVLFGESLHPESEHGITVAIRNCNVFIAVGTSGTVMPASSFVQWAKYAGAETVLVNLEELEGVNHCFDRSYYGKAEEILPTLLQ